MNEEIIEDKMDDGSTDSDVCNEATPPTLDELVEAFTSFMDKAERYHGKVICSLIASDSKDVRWIQYSNAIEISGCGITGEDVRWLAAQGHAMESYYTISSKNADSIGKGIELLFKNRIKKRDAEKSTDEY